MIFKSERQSSHIRPGSQTQNSKPAKIRLYPEKGSGSRRNSLLPASAFRRNSTISKSAPCQRLIIQKSKFRNIDFCMIGLGLQDFQFRKLFYFFWLE
jgi:hypothetical protein